MTRVPNGSALVSDSACDSRRFSVAVSRYRRVKKNSEQSSVAIAAVLLGLRLLRMQSAKITEMMVKRETSKPIHAEYGPPRRFCGRSDVTQNATRYSSTERTKGLERIGASRR